MYFLQASAGFNWKSLLLGNEDWNFLPETSLRTLIMFLVIVTALRLLGKRGIKQLSVFELVVIIGLGSAAGDPMFYKDVGLLPVFIVFTMVIILYRIVIHLVGTNKKFELLVEGKPVCLIKAGKFSIQNFKKENLGADEFFSELRLRGISQMGQVEEAIVETSGNVSIFFYEDEAVKYGLPVMPSALDGAIMQIKDAGHYSCIFCGYTEKMQPANKVVCPECEKYKWIKASNKKRVL